MVVGAAFMVKRKVLSQIGLFDANYFLYHEEWDLSYRAQQAGYRTVCVNGASCWHKVSGDDYAKLYTPNRAYYFYRNFILFAARHKNTLGPYDFLFRHLLYDGPGKVPSYFVLQSVKKKKLSTVKSYLQGIRDGLVIFGKVANT
jgi:GT2 family glycosyltransferase